MSFIAAAPSPRAGWPRRLAAAGLAVLSAALLLACGSGALGIVVVRATATAGAGAASNVAATSTVTVEVPPRPENPFGGGLAVQAYLAGGRANVEACLPELVSAWGLPEVDGDRCRQVDLDGDGEDELLFLVTVPGEPVPPGEVWFFQDANEDYAFFSSARALANDVLAGVSLVSAAQDLTGDGQPEAVISSRACEGERCTLGVVVASMHRGRAEDLAPEQVDLGPAEAVTSLEVADADGDGLVDIVARSEGSDDPAAGPQRAMTRVLSWNGLEFTAREERDAPEFLIHLVQDADDAYRRGDDAAARELYLQAAADSSLRDWRAEQGRARSGRSELVPYSLFRAALAARTLGDGANTRDLLERAAEHEESMHGAAAALYLERLVRGDDAVTACTAVERLLNQFRDRYLEAWDYGYANPEHTIETLCG